jgi:hypothetical protein
MQDPFVIAALPFSDVRDSWNFDNWYDEQCTFHSDSPDVVYAYTPAQDEVINISTCANSAYDTKLFVYENAEGNVVACNDDWCSTPSYPDPYVAHIEALAVCRTAPAPTLRRTGASARTVSGSRARRAPISRARRCRSAPAAFPAARAWRGRPSGIARS